MTAGLLIVAFVAAVVGLLSLSQATAGVGILAFACLLAIVARIAQASAQATALSPPAGVLTFPDTSPAAPRRTPVADRPLVIVMVAIVIAVATVIVTMFLTAH